MSGDAMDGSVARRQYRPLYKHIRIGSKEYAIIDQELAATRAQEYFLAALHLLDGELDDNVQQQIDRELVLATDFGSSDAPFLLALRILADECTQAFSAEEAVVFFKVAAERDHPEAAFRMACSYAGMGNFIEIENAGQRHFANLDARQRCRLAEHYFNKAVELEHQEAIEELIIAYAYGRGFLNKSTERFVHLCEQQIRCRNQSVTLGYGAWLSGMTVEGDDPLNEAIDISTDTHRGLEYLLQAAKGDDIGLCQHALHLICMGMQRGCWNHKTPEKMRRKLIKDVHHGNQMLALYLAWHAIPYDQRPEMPDIMEKYPLPQLATLMEIDEDTAINFLDIAFFGHDETVSMLAKDILSHAFGRYFVGSDGMLMVD